MKISRILLAAVFACGLAASTFANDREDLQVGRLGVESYIYGNDGSLTISNATIVSPTITSPTISGTSVIAGSGLVGSNYVTEAGNRVMAGPDGTNTYFMQTGIFTNGGVHVFPVVFGATPFVIGSYTAVQGTNQSPQFTAIDRTNFTASAGGSTVGRYFAIGVK